MKNFPPALLAFLQDPKNVEFAIVDLYQVILRNGYHMYIADYQTDVTLSGQVHSATKWGQWHRGAITSNIGTESESMTLTMVVDSLENVVTYPPANLPLLQCAQIGLFDGAIITILTVYMPTPGDTSLGFEVKFSAIMGEISEMDDTKCEFTVHDLRYLLNVQMPRKIIQSGCAHVLYDSGCLANPASFSENHTVIAVTGTYNPFNNQLGVTITGSFTHAAPRYNQGTITWTSGANTGFSQTIRVQGTNTITMNIPMLFPIQVGDTFTIFAGCDHTTSTCNNVFNNLIHYGGFPFVPDPEVIV